MRKRYALRPDSGGAGKHRGGLGIAFAFEALASMTVSTTIERSHCRPWGLEGGGEALGNGVGVRIDGEWSTGLANAKRSACAGATGSCFSRAAAASARQERDPERLRSDVREGYVSAEAAAREYGGTSGHRLRNRPPTGRRNDDGPAPGRGVRPTGLRRSGA